jgi:TPR repeat protein
MINLGDLYLSGTGVDRDIHEALRWYRRAAHRGEPQGQMRLAKLYEQGVGVDRSLVAAHAWYSLAAESGNKEAARERDRLAVLLNQEQLKQSAQLIREQRVTE